MEKIEVFDIFVNGFSHTWKHNMVLGILFVLFGICIVVIPQLFVALVASFFVLCGLILIGSAWTIRRYRKRYDGFRDDLYKLF